MFLLFVALSSAETFQLAWEGPACPVPLELDAEAPLDALTLKWGAQTAVCDDQCTLVSTTQSPVVVAAHFNGAETFSLSLTCEAVVVAWNCGASGCKPIETDSLAMIAR